MVDQTSYGIGEDVQASRVRITNLTARPTQVELKAWVDAPSIQQSILNLGATGLLTLPPGVDTDLAPITLFSVTAETVPGVYQFGCRTLNPVTGEESALSLDAFTVTAP